MKSFLKNYNQSPRKVRLLADLVRGKRADEAMLVLEFTPKRAAEVVRKVLESAVANSGQDANTLIVKDIIVDKGIVLKRHRPRARGRAFPVRHRMSHIKVELVPAK